MAVSPCDLNLDHQALHQCVKVGVVDLGKGGCAPSMKQQHVPLSAYDLRNLISEVARKPIEKKDDAFVRFVGGRKGLFQERHDIL